MVVNIVQTFSSLVKRIWCDSNFVLFVIVDGDQLAGVFENESYVRTVAVTVELIIYDSGSQTGGRDQREVAWTFWEGAGAANNI